MNGLRRNQLLNLLGAALIGLVAWSFFPLIHNGFVGYDDPDYVTANAHVQAGFTWETIRWAFSSFQAGNWNPVTWLSHILDYRLFGLRPWGHHLTSLLLH